MQAFTSAIDIPVGDPSVICRLLDQGFSETSVKRARIAWTCLTESITHRELLSRVFDTNSRSAGWRMLCDWFLPKTPAEKSKWKRQFNELVMEKKEEPMRFFARVDKVVGVLGSLGVHMPVEDANLKIVEVLTDEYEFEQRTILYKDNITRAEIEAIVRQRYTIMSRGASTRVRNVGQALVANKPTRRIRKQQDSGKYVAGKGVSSGVAVAKNDNSNAKEGGEEVRRHADKCHPCLEPGHRWFDCTAHVSPAANKSQKGYSEIISCLAIGMLGKRDAVEKRAQSGDGTEQWIADSGATFHMTRSADLLRDLHPSEAVSYTHLTLPTICSV